MRPRSAAVVLVAAALAGCAILPAPEPESPAVEVPALPPAEVPTPPPAIEVPAPPAIEAPVPPAVQVPALPVEPAMRSDVELLVEYFQRVRKLPGAELVREQERARAAFGRSGSELDRMRFAMALALPNATGSDDTRALELLEPMVKNRASTLHALAYMVSAFVQEQRRLGANAQGMQRKLDQLRSMERSLIEREQAGKIRP